MTRVDGQPDRDRRVRALGRADREGRPASGGREPGGAPARPARRQGAVPARRAGRAPRRHRRSRSWRARPTARSSSRPAGRSLGPKGGDVAAAPLVARQRRPRPAPRASPAGTSEALAGLSREIAEVRAHVAAPAPEAAATRHRQEVGPPPPSSDRAPRHAGQRRRACYDGRNGLRRPRPHPRRHPRVRDGAAPLARPLAGRDLRRPLLRARGDVVAAPRGRHHPHRLGGGDLRARRPRRRGRAHRLRVHRRSRAGRRWPAPPRPPPTSRPTHAPSRRSRCRPRPSTADTARRASASCPSPSASRSSSAPTARRARTTPGSRR